MNWCSAHERRDPDDGAPVVLDIPRSGAEYLCSFRAAAPFADVQRSISMYAEKAFGGVPDAGATWRYACFPNIVIDANRRELDIDPAMLDREWLDAVQPSGKSRSRMA